MINDACRRCEENPKLKGRKFCLRCLNIIEREKRKEKIAIKKLREQTRKDKKKLRHEQSQEGRKELKKKAEALLHLIIRKEATKKTGFANCYTCGELKTFSDLEAGHRHHGKLDLDERNLKVQCVKCNHWLSGNLGEYERHLIEDFGLEWAKQLKQDADRDTGQYEWGWLKEIIEKYQNKLKELSTGSRLDKTYNV